MARAAARRREGERMIGSELTKKGSGLLLERQRDLRRIVGDDEVVARGGVRDVLLDHAWAREGYGRGSLDGAGEERAGDADLLRRPARALHDLRAVEGLPVHDDGRLVG